MQRNSQGPRDNQHIEQLLAEADRLGRGEDSTFLCSHYIHLWGDTKKQVKDAVAALMERADNTNKMVVVQETIALKEAWFNFLPGYIGPHDEVRNVELNSRQTAFMMPVFGSPTFLGNFRTEALFETLTNSIQNIVIKGGHVSNYNILVTGASGKGKSFFTNMFLAQLSRLNPQVVIVDLGDSYRKTVELAGGVSYEMELGNERMCVNPFDNILDDDFDDDDTMVTLTLLETLAFDPNAKGLSIHQQENLRKAFQILQTQSRNSRTIPTLTDYHRILTDIDSDLSSIIARWTRSSASVYSKILDGETRLAMTSDWIAFELGRVKDNPVVLMIMVQLIFKAVSRMASRLTSNTPKLLIFEEGGVVMKQKIFRDYLDNSFRTMRKYGVSVLGVAQQFGDWAPIRADGSRDTSITNQISHYFSVQLDYDETVAVKQAFQLSNHERDLLASCTTSKGVCSHVFYMLKGGDGTECYRLIVRPTPISYAIATTDEPDRLEINNLRMNESLTIQDAIIRFAEKYPQGVQRARMRAAV
jgi:conjugal transfer ATP-binding protein TraC